MTNPNDVDPGDEKENDEPEPEYVSGDAWDEIQEDGSCSVERPDGTSIDSSGRIWN